uniref:Uncharacterized protein n=1 Tax=Lepeophtheirus salmonis TaxID=72036 RepID=A0A0K2SZI6_LEPSM
MEAKRQSIADLICAQYSNKTRKIGTWTVTPGTIATTPTWSMRFRGNAGNCGIRQEEDAPNWSPKALKIGAKE